jgi:hypothetical protein
LKKYGLEVDAEFMWLRKWPLNMLLYFGLHTKEKMPLADWPLMSVGGSVPTI